MKHDITQILSTCCAQYGASTQRTMDASLHNNRIDKSRMLFIFIADTLGCPLGRCGTLVGWDNNETRANIVASRRNYKTDAKFKRRADLVLDLFHRAQKEEKENDKEPVSDGFYTKEELIAMRNACTESIRFMESYGLPRDDGTVRHAVRNGYGYYPTPITFDK